MFLPNEWWKLTVVYGEGQVVFQRGVICVALSMLLACQAALMLVQLVRQRKQLACATRNRQCTTNMLTFCTVSTCMCGGIFAALGVNSGDPQFSYHWVFAMSNLVYVACVAALGLLHGAYSVLAASSLINLSLWVLLMHAAIGRLLACPDCSQLLSVFDTISVSCYLMYTLLSLSVACCCPAKSAELIPRVINPDSTQVPLLGADSAFEPKPPQKDGLSAYTLAGLVSRWTMSYLDPLLRVGATRQLDLDDLDEMPAELGTSFACRTTAAALADDSRSSSGTLSRALWSLFGIHWVFLGMLQLVIVMLSFSGPLILQQLLSFLEGDDSDMAAVGIGWALAMGATSGITALVSTQFNVLALNIQLKLRAGILGAVFRSMISGPPTLRCTLSPGKVTNFISVDVQKLMDAVTSLHQFWSLPLQVLGTLTLLYLQVHFAFLAGLAVLLVFVPINMMISKRIGSLTGEMMHHRDDRVRLTGEVLAGIKVIKMQAWEVSLLHRIHVARTLEFDKLRQRKYLDAACVYLWASTPVLVPLATFSAIVLTSATSSLTASTVFTTVTLLNLLIFPLNAYSWVVTGVLEANISLKRLQAFILAQPAVRPSAVVGELGSGTECVLKGSHQHVQSVAVDTAQCAVRFACDVTVSKYDRILLRGRVGSGKTSVLRAILGELEACGSAVVAVSSCCTIAYAPQVPWIRSGTLDYNVVCDNVVDPVRLRRVIHACCLDTDVVAWQHGLKTHISNDHLSGGQKVRIGLARALYASSSMLLIDDPTASLDSIVGAEVIRRVFGDRTPPSAASWLLFDDGRCSFLHVEPRTVIVAAHDTRFVSFASKVLEVEDGLVKESNSITESPCSMVLAGVNNCEIGPDSWDNSVSAPATEEERQYGTIHTHVIRRYVRAVGTLLTCCVLSSLLFMQLSRNSSDWFLSIWSDVQSGTVDTIASDREVLALVAGWRPTQFLMVYGLLALGNTIFTVARAWSFARAGLLACKYVHDTLLQSCLMAPLQFHEVVGVGRLMNRLSADQYSTDETLTFQLNIFLAQGVGLLGTILVLSYATSGWFVALVLPLGIAYYFLQLRYRKTSREVKRLDSTTKSPIFALFSECLAGADVIRAHSCNRLNPMVHTEFVRLVQELDPNQRTSFYSALAAQWLGLRLQLIGSIVLLAIALFAVLNAVLADVGAAAASENMGVVDGSPSLESASIGSGVAGLALSYSIPIVGCLQGLINSFAETEKEMIAVERAMEYINVPPEAFVAERVADRALALSLNSDRPLLHADGRQSLSHAANGAGQLSLFDLTVTYDSMPRPALNGVSMVINAGEHVGICGRTGSGKSTLLSAIWRLVQWKTGGMFIDGEDAATLDNATLRSKLAIIPQHPLLFAGTVRFNVDPRQAHTDEQIVAALVQCGLVPTKIKSLEDEVDAGGVNFSVGERQLLCVARALLQEAAIVCIDEATAATDAATEATISRLLETRFAGVTMLIIAHHLSTLQRCSRIFVFDAGSLVESGTPAALMQNPRSHFAQLANAS